MAGTTPDSRPSHTGNRGDHGAVDKRGRTLEPGYGTPPWVGEGGTLKVLRITPTHLTISRLPLLFPGSSMFP